MLNDELNSKFEILNSKQIQNSNDQNSKLKSQNSKPQLKSQN
jgi:hypothetical protein